MNCNTVQDLILTDYSDGQLPASHRQQLERHLSGCADCRALAQQVRQETFAPLESQRRFLPDEFVWLRLKREIERQQAIAQTPVRRFDLLGAFVWPFRSWVIAASVLATVFIVPFVYLRTAQKPSYMSIVMDSEGPTNDVTSGIEQYFL